MKAHLFPLEVAGSCLYGCPSGGKTHGGDKHTRTITHIPGIAPVVAHSRAEFTLFLVFPDYSRFEQFRDVPEEGFEPCDFADEAIRVGDVSG